jgi:hypothetical protein
MFRKILHAGDGSGIAFLALSFSLGPVKRHWAELNLVSVEDIQWIPGPREEVCVRIAIGQAWGRESVVP